MFAITAQAIHISYIVDFFSCRIIKCPSHLVTSQKRLKMSFKLTIDQKMLKFWKVAAGNLKIGKLPVTLAVLNFHELFVMKFESNLS